MVMYLTPLILMPLEMTCFGSLLSEKEAAMALRSSSETFSHISISAIVWCSRGSGPISHNGRSGGRAHVR
jgi:hypothetical protein